VRFPVSGIREPESRPMRIRSLVLSAVLTGLLVSLA
jgi:hypothetical protein